MKARSKSAKRVRLNASIPRRLKKRLAMASSAQARSMSDIITELLERELPELPTVGSKGLTWIDELAGTVHFTDADIRDDERLARLVKGARSLPDKDRA
jgi:hypothetical protein